MCIFTVDLPFEQTTLAILLYLLQEKSPALPRGQSVSDSSSPVQSKLPNTIGPLPSYLELGNAFGSTWGIRNAGST